MLTYNVKWYAENLKKRWPVFLVHSQWYWAQCVLTCDSTGRRSTQKSQLRYEVFRLGFDQTLTQMVIFGTLATTVFSWSTDRVHLSHRCSLSFADHLHLLNMSNWRYGQTLQNGPACYRDRTVQLLVRTKTRHHQVHFLTAIVLVFVCSHCCNFYFYLVLILCPTICSRFRNITQHNFRFSFRYENRSA